MITEEWGIYGNIESMNIVWYMQCITMYTVNIIIISTFCSTSSFRIDSDHELEWISKLWRKLVVVALGTKRTKDKGSHFVSFGVVTHSHFDTWERNARNMVCRTAGTLLSCSKHPRKFSIHEWISYGFACHPCKPVGLSFGIAPKSEVWLRRWQQPTFRTLLEGAREVVVFLPIGFAPSEALLLSFSSLWTTPTCAILYLLIWIGSIQCT